MTIPENLLETGQWFEPGYQPVLDFHGWRVAMLRHDTFLGASTLHQVERHRNTNEVFILTEGEADLILFSGADVPEEGYVVPMTRHVAYNIPDHGWHHVVMSENAHIILFERTETSRETSDYAELNEMQLEGLRAQLRF